MDKDNNKPISIYFHGYPGGFDDVVLVSDILKDQLISADVFLTGAALNHHDMINEYVAGIGEYSKGAPVHLIGFSLGSFNAMCVASKLGAEVCKLDLISAVAPLQMGDFLPKMAGRSVFQVAQGQKWGFDLMVAGQVLLCRLSVNLFVKALFSTAQSKDAELIKNNEFRNSISTMLKAAMLNDAQNYKYVVRAYVRDWESVLDNISVPVQLWHGKEDNWSPVEMALELSLQYRNVFEVNVFEGLSHFSTLQEALPKCLKFKETLEG
ncbi:alpha/beta hydrolase [Amylibacter sp. SFDW26]|uniref:alpha/beta fold hydrolase n=1 Tax=Amylibacter sp. SFDW26 TaxID=2652722 RepID=UPI001261CEF8|nr:alpha/beta hydrolase [Amylibacter sp. SFDW26]KAB7610405.1 alpha/beta hydrolase [Amylibacter sp. SFDW26]